MSKVSVSLGEIATFLNARLIGDDQCQITALNTLADAKEEQLSFLSNPKYRKQLPDCKASAIILDSEDAGGYQGNLLVMKNPYLGYARVTAMFSHYPDWGQGIHPAAVVAGSASINPSAKIGPASTIAEGVQIGKNTLIGAGCHLGEGVVIGSDCRIADGVNLYYGVRLGDQVTIHSGAVIGADGFGFAHDGQGWQKIHQLGGVIIGSRVEIGACTTIDRGALGNTVVEDGVILDDHVHIAHNVHIGKNTAMAAYTGISGSSTIGDNCIFAGKAGVVGHVQVCAGVTVTAGTIISRSIDQPGTYSGGTGYTTNTTWRKNVAGFNRLADLLKRVARLERGTGSKAAQEK